MKNLFAALIAVAIMMVSIPAFAGVTWYVYGNATIGYEIQAVVTLTPATMADPVVIQDDAGNPLDLSTQYLYIVETYYGGTAPTDNSDLYIYAHSTSGKDVLGGGGANRVDNATNNIFTPLVDSAPKTVPLYGKCYLFISGNSQAGAITTVIIKTIPKK